MHPLFKPFETTGIGSLPFIDPLEAVDLVVSYCDIPFWPQLPRRSFRELMIPQYAEGLPGLRLDPERETVLVEGPGQEALNRFYEQVSRGAPFPISPEFSSGFHAFVDALRGRRYRALKGQITGPLTFTLGLKDDRGRHIYFDEELREVALLLLQQKARWQVERLSELAERVVIFIDEPILTAIGSSSYLGVEPDEVERLIRETASAIKAEGGVAGVHCCGRADWGMLIRTGVDILNFDAYEYFDTLGIYADELAGFLQRGGHLAWGIVPTTGAIAGEDLQGLKDRLLSEIKGLSARIPEETLRARSLLTPSCGAGGMGEEEARRAFALLKSLAEAVRG